MTKLTPTRRLTVYTVGNMDIRRDAAGCQPIEALTLSLVDDEDGYCIDMLRVSLRAGSDGALQYRLYSPEQGVDEKAVAARNLADRLRPALGRVFAATVSDERERASLIYAAMVVETVRTDGTRPQVTIETDVTDAVSGAALFSHACAILLEDRAIIDAYFARRSAA